MFGWGETHLRRKARRDAEKANRTDVDDGVDPDLVGIVPGPQPPIEW